jgi:hypothetical protein
MDKNSNAVANRIQIFFYSLLITCMSVFHKTGMSSKTADISQPIFEQSDTLKTGNEVEPVQTNKAWEILRLAITSILIWTLLGFAAGFLIGMINPR